MDVHELTSSQNACEQHRRFPVAAVEILKCLCHLLSQHSFVHTMNQLLYFKSMFQTKPIIIITGVVSVNMYNASYSMFHFGHYN